ncbi:MAG TPA: hypothetical protein VJ276_03160 [Thermoanaerobaculia bacterium]|nr:hypothetical protein [Thermoanaerobaculia bacterium]
MKIPRFGRNLHHLIIDYAAATETFGFLDFDAFIPVWVATNALAEEARRLKIEVDDLPFLLTQPAD